MCGEKWSSRVSGVAASGSPPRVRGKEYGGADALEACGITPACAGKSFRPRRALAVAQDHPRVCGEKTRCSVLAGWQVGSPPRVRGKAAASRNTSRPSGITPACAGKSSRYKHTIISVQDHPRVCGEKAYHNKSPFSSGGSPPRVRGKGRRYCRSCSTQGITPACAGKSSKFARSDTTEKDHPRVCGEKFQSQRVQRRAQGSPGEGRSTMDETKSQRVQRRAQGSPPRVRGKEKRRCELYRQLGITPACAGKSGTHAVERFGAGDHPRVCGEKTKSGNTPMHKPGSPPRVRGKVLYPAICALPVGITPACAGKSFPIACVCAMF